MTSLFRIDPRVQHILPASYEKARILASRIVRSEFHKATLCKLFGGKAGRTQHIDMEDLTQLLENNEVFVVDKIRLKSFKDARACTQREINPAKLYFNPLLLEMQDREYEQLQIDARSNDSEWPDLLYKQPPFKPTGSGPVVGTLGVFNNNLEFNSLVQASQAEARKEILAAQKQQQAAIDAAEAALLQAQSVSRERRHGQKRALDLQPDSEAPKKPTPTPSSMTIVEKNVLMLTILQVHEVDHLLMYALSDALIAGQTPNKKFLADDSDYFTDVGHYMERALFGYSISHSSNHDYITEFGINEILGSRLQRGLSYVMQPSKALLALVNNPLLTHIDGVEINITADTLQLMPASPVEYTVPTDHKRKGRASELMNTGDQSSPFSSDDEFARRLTSSATETTEISDFISKGKA